MNENQKLLRNKPKKARLKQAQLKKEASPSSISATAPSSISATAPSSISATAPSSSSMGSQPPPPPPPQAQLPKDPFSRRFKYFWPLLLAVNLSVGAYILVRTTKKNTDVEEEAAAGVPAAPAGAALPATPTTVGSSSSLITEPVKLREPIPGNQQRELYKWLLEEKRKVTPKDNEEKKRLDEEKAILKQFIRAKSIPNF